MTHPSSFRTRLEVFPRFASGLCILSGILVLAGWQWEAEILKRVLPGFVAMNPATALTFILAGASLWLKTGSKTTLPAVRNSLAKRLATICALIVLTIGVLRIFGYLLEWETGADEWIFAEKLKDGGFFSPNRMALHEAICFILAGMGLLAIDFTTRETNLRPTEFFSIAVALISLLSIMGYSYRVHWLYAVLALQPMALHTAILLFTLASGLLFARPDRGGMAVITGDTQGGSLARRQFSGMLCIVFFLGWLRLEGERRGYFDAELGVTVYTVANITLFGALIWWSAHSLHVVDANRKLLEMELKQFFDLSPDMLCIASLKGYFTRVNLAFREVLGYTPEEMLARPIMDFVHPDDVEMTQKELGRLREGVPTIQFENRYQCKDGTIRWLSWKCMPKPEEGTIYATARDVTFDRKIAARIEELNADLQQRAGQLESANGELSAANRFLDSVIENIPDMIFVKDAVNLRFVRFNRAGEDLLGYSREEMFGKGDYDFFPQEEADAFTSKDREVLAQGLVVSIPEEPIFTKHKGERTLRTKKIPVFDENDRPQYLLGISEDVTDTKEKEREILLLNAMLVRRASELEEVNQELESFSYSVSHDLRAPLRHIQGYVEMLRTATEGQLGEKPGRYIKTISAASIEMGMLIDDLLAFSRMGRLEMKEAPVPLNSLLQETLQGLEIETKNRRITWKIADLPSVLGDPTMLKQVLVNLVGNAVKYSRLREHAEIEIGRAGEDKGMCVFFVRDNGAGFDMQYAHKLFGVFQRLHRAEEFEGTGIGLAIVRRVIGRHGGRVWAEAAPDRGATFYFTLKPALAV